jgi:hypothetical protein
MAQVSEGSGDGKKGLWRGDTRFQHRRAAVELRAASTESGKRSAGWIETKVGEKENRATRSRYRAIQFM